VRTRAVRGATRSHVRGHPGVPRRTHASLASRAGAWLAVAMPFPDASPQPLIATIDHLGKRYTVSCRVSFDGIEYVGRLWFAEEGATQEIELTERQLHDCIDRLRHSAGIEE